MTPTPAQPGSPSVAALPVLTSSEKRSLRRQRYHSLTFDRVDFANADFRLTRFANVTFQQCDLSHADLRGVEFDGCRFVGCDLASVRLGHNRFVDSVVRNCRHLDLEQKKLLLSQGVRLIESLRV